MVQIRQGLTSLVDKRTNLIKLIHEPCPEIAALQAQKFQRINQEMLAFQSVLSEVIDDFNTHFEGLQGKCQNEFLLKPYLKFIESQTATTAQFEKEIRHRVKLF